MRREGYLDDNVDKKDEKGLLDERGDIVHDEVDDDLTTASSTTTPRIFIDGTLGGLRNSADLLKQLNPNNILIRCNVRPGSSTSFPNLAKLSVPLSPSR